MEYLSQYALFFAQSATLVIAIIITVAAVIALTAKDKLADKANLSIKKLNKKYQSMADTLHKEVLSKKAYKEYKKEEKKKLKLSESNKNTEERKTIYVIDFKGDIRASELPNLRETITAILTTAKAGDEVLLNLESPGGLVHAYGLAASQLQRIRDHKINLTVAIDKVAASGGYLMACIGNKILAAPFAIIGSIGVIAQLPNLNRFLKKNDIDFEQITAGEYKRTLTLFGENTDAGREKFKDDLEDIHTQFKDHIQYHRPHVDIEKVATGEHWLAKRAKDLALVDELITSDDYLLSAAKDANLYLVSYQEKESFTQKFAKRCQMLINKVADTGLQRSNEQFFL